MSTEQVNSISEAVGGIHLGHPIKQRNPNVRNGFKMHMEAKEFNTKPKQHGDYV